MGYVTCSERHSQVMADLENLPPCHTILYSSIKQTLIKCLLCSLAMTRCWGGGKYEKHICFNLRELKIQKRGQRITDIVWINPHPLLPRNSKRDEETCLMPLSQLLADAAQGLRSPAAIISCVLSWLHVSPRPVCRDQSEEMSLSSVIVNFMHQIGQLWGSGVQSTPVQMFL